MFRRLLEASGLKNGESTSQIKESRHTPLEQTFREIQLREKLAERFYFFGKEERLALRDYNFIFQLSPDTLATTAPKMGAQSEYERMKQAWWKCLSELQDFPDIDVEPMKTLTQEANKIFNNQAEYKKYVAARLKYFNTILWAKGFNFVYSLERQGGDIENPQLLELHRRLSTQVSLEGVAQVLSIPQFHGWIIVDSKNYNTLQVSEIIFGRLGRTRDGNMREGAPSAFSVDDYLEVPDIFLFYGLMTVHNEKHASLNQQQPLSPQ